MSTTTTYTGVRIVDMPDLGAVTDSTSVVGEHAGSGLFRATALRDYVTAYLTPAVTASLNNTGRNLLHNPGFNVQQRGLGPWSSGGYQPDRWYLGAVGGSFTSQIVPVGDPERAVIGDDAARYQFNIAYTGGSGAGDQTYLHQSIEDVSRLAGKTVTVSFWALALSTPPKVAVLLYQVFGTGGSPSATTNTVAQVVQLTGPYARYSVTTSLPSLAGKTVGTNNDHYTMMRLGLSSGATGNALFGGIGVQSSSVLLWGMQLEVGSVATQLEKPDPRYDLSNCQRFFYNDASAFWAGQGTTGVSYVVQSHLPTTMRAIPVAVLVNNNSLNMTSVAITAVSRSTVQVNGTASVTGSVVIGATGAVSADL